MKRVAVASLVLFGLTGVANADSPGGWSQFDAMVKAKQAPAKVAQVQKVQQPVAEFAAAQKSGTWVSPPNQNEGANN